VALQVARSEQNQTAAQRILNNLGVAYREQHQHAASISCLEESIAISRSTGSKETYALALMNLGVAHHRSGQFTGAVSCFESALALSLKLGLDAVRRKILSCLGNAYYDMSRYDDASGVYREALELCRSEADRRGEEVVLVSLGMLYQEQGFPDEALTCFTQGLEIAREMLDPVGEGRALQSLGSAAWVRGAGDEAISALEASAQIAGQVRDADTVYLASLMLGDIYLSQDSTETTHWYNTGKARHWYNLSRSAARDMGDLQREAKTTRALAVIADSENEAELALTYYQRTVALLRDSLDRRGLASALCRTGSVLTNLRRSPEALACFEEAAAVARDLGDPSVELEALKFLADLLQDLGQVSDVSAVRRRISEIGGPPPIQHE
jgi:tetratricopeptide (TPR) repeat protein